MAPMKLCILSLGSRGDVQPYAALGLALQARGHQVTLATHVNFQAYVQDLGLGYAPLPSDSRAMVAEPAVARSVAAGQVLSFFRAVRERMYPERVALQDAALEAAQGADVVLGSAVTDQLALAVSEKVGARFAWSDLQPMTPTSAYPSFALLPGVTNAGPFNRLSHELAAWGWWRLSRRDVYEMRRRWSLPTPSASPLTRARSRGLLQLHGYSPSLVPRPKDWGPWHVQTGAWDLPPAAAQALPGDHHDAGFIHWLEDGPAPVFFGFGSMAILSGEALLDLVGDVCEDLEIRGVIGAGWTDLHGPDCDLPEGVAIADACDYAWLFPQCAAVMHHGGSGTTHTASLAGSPQVVCSLFADQPFWGRRIQRSGAGVHLPFRNLSVESLREAVLEALAEDKADAAAALAQSMQAEDGLGAAAAALEALASTPPAG
jgi:sterol 3beta-glucosyltransferase